MGQNYQNYSYIQSCFDKGAATEDAKSIIFNKSIISQPDFISQYTHYMEKKQENKDEQFKKL